MQDTKRDLTKMEKHLKLLKLLSQLLVILVVISAGLSLSSSIYKPSRSTNKLMGEDLAKYQQDIEVLKGKLKQVEDFQSKPVGKVSENYSMSELKTNFDTRITRIEDLLQGDPMRSLSVPLLRRDLDSINLRITEFQVAVREDFNRIYNVFMWAFGILVVVVLGTFAYFQRKLDAIVRPNDKE